MSLARLFDQMKQIGYHALYKVHAPAAPASRAFAVTKVVLHIDNQKHCVIRVDSLCKR
jgi:hypothetical protein